MLPIHFYKPLTKTNLIAALVKTLKKCVSKPDNFIILPARYLSTVTLIKTSVYASNFKARTNNSSKNPWGYSNTSQVSLESFKTTKSFFFNMNSFSTSNKNYDSITRSKDWTDPELSLLNQAVEKSGKDWKAVSQLVETRSRSQCRRKYSDLLRNKNYHPSFKYTKEEEEHILYLVSKHGTKNWPLVLSLSGLKCSQLQLTIGYHYIKKTKNEKLKSWKLEEDAALIKAVQEAQNHSWSDISKKIGSSHTDIACRERWSQINPFLKTGKWSQEEIVQLIKLAEKHQCNWDQVSFYLRTRSVQRCKYKWFEWNYPIYKRGLWSDFEKLLLLELRDRCKNNVRQIAFMLGTRSYDGVKKQLKRLQV